MTMQSTVYVVDDDPGALRSLCWLLRQAEMPVVAYPSGREFLDAYRRGQPGCLVLDVRMPEIDGLEVQERLRADGVEMPIIFITAHGDVPSCVRAMKGGAIDFLQKPLNGPAFIERVRNALQVASDQAQQGEATGVLERMHRLSPREKEVLDQILAGKSIKQIAAASSVAVQTVWKQRLAVHKKMEVENDVALVRLITAWSSYRRS